MSARFIVGEAREVLASLPEASVDLVVSSPPFLALRSYLPADHPDKALEIGSESTPGEFLDVLLDVVEACARVLAPHGSLVFELGDTYAGSGGAGGDYGPDGMRDGQPKFVASRRHMTTSGDKYADHPPHSVAGGKGWPLDKSKVLVPQLFAIALSYGFNPLTGRTTEPWRVRNTVAWCRPNPPVGRDGDKFRPATSFLTVATKARDRYWDGDAVRVTGTDPDRTQVVAGARIAPERFGERETAGKTMQQNPAGAPLLDWWSIPTEPYSGSHYATFPRALVVPIVKSMCPEKVCRVCGKPSTRITETEYIETPNRPLRDDEARRYGSIDGKRHNDHRATSQNTIGWSDCGCCMFECYCDGCEAGSACDAKWRAGHVLDPFGGSGTTAAVATGHGYDCTLIDLDERNADLARERVGMFLEVETLTERVA